ncbi:MAG: hypothetical protein IPM37_02260 [Hahellaceae bacterium]|nr:hypothetical protein [Hahellaceae bacterium]
MTRKSLLLSALALAVPVVASANEFELNISNKSVNGQLTFLNASRQAEFGAGYIYREGGMNIANIDIHARGQTALGNFPTTVGIGAQVSMYEEDKIDGGAIGIGGYAHVKIPEVPGLGIKAAAHFAPSITSFNDLEQFFRADVKVTYRVIQNADIYVGYRSVIGDIRGRGNESLDENAHVGFMLMF